MAEFTIEKVDAFPTSGIVADRIYVKKSSNDKEFEIAIGNIAGNAIIYLKGQPLSGSYTPSITGSSSNPSVTYSTRVGQYVILGELAYVSIGLSWSALSGGSGDIRINLPSGIDTSGIGTGQILGLTCSGIDIPSSAAELSAVVSAGSSPYIIIRFRNVLPYLGVLSLQSSGLINISGLFKMTFTL